MIFLKRKLSILLSSIYFLFFIYHLLFHFLTFTPILSIMRESSYSKEGKFKNEMGYLEWNSEEREKIIFYFNNWNGNCSTRVGNMLEFKKNFNHYRVVQLEYPGYGYSGEEELSIENMISMTGNGIKEYIKENNIKEYIFWGEGMGNYIVGGILNNFLFYPKMIIHYNIYPSFFSYIKEKYSFLFLLFFPSFLKYKSNIYRYPTNEPMIYFLSNKKKLKFTGDSFYNLDKVPFSKKKIIMVEGEEKSIFFHEKNTKEIKNILFKGFHSTEQNVS